MCRYDRIRHVELKRNPPTLRSSQIKEKLRTFIYAWNLKPIRHSEKTLDLGCGWGVSLSVNSKFWLVDADPKCIAHVQTLSDRAFLHDLAKPLPFEDNFFENAFTHDVLEHLEESEMIALFAETRRVIQTGGLFMNVVPNRKGFDLGVNPEVGHKRFVTEQEIKSAANQTGFEFIKSYRSPLGTRFSEVLSHNKLVTICRAK